MPVGGTTTVSVRPATLDRLYRLKRRRERYDDLVNRLLDAAEN